MTMLQNIVGRVFETRKTSDFAPLIVTTIVAGAYLVWQLIGLRYANHDDINFNLYA